MTTTPPATGPALPAPCCADGAAWLERMAAAAEAEDGTDGAMALLEWSNHQVEVHVRTFAPFDGCVDCAELTSHPDLGDPLDLVRPVDRAAALHFVTHEVVEPLRAHHRASRVATLSQHGGNDN